MRNSNVDWRRYHEILGIMIDRELTVDEKNEYRFFLPILEEIDSNERIRCEPVIRSLMF